MNGEKKQRDTIDGNIYVTKMDGVREEFDINKLRHSLKRARASEGVIDEIVDIVLAEAYDGISTNTIYNRAYEILEKKERRIAARYSLRRALTDFGPTGFPFEYFVGELFRAKGYDVTTGEVVLGECVEHEVDMVAENESEKIFMEIKFHNNMKIKSDMKVALYVKARFDDILKGHAAVQKEKQGWLLTNTKFTKNAIHYAECVGLNLISWSYPEDNNLQTMIEETGLHPLTCLTTLPKRDKERMMGEGIVLCRDVESKPGVLEKLGLSPEKLAEVREEAKNVCIPFELLK